MISSVHCTSEVVTWKFWSASHAPSRCSRSGHRKLFVTEAGAGDPVVLLHGGGPGATGVSNYSRNIDVLAGRFRVIVPDMPGYGQSSKELDHSDPFGDLAFAIRGLLDELGIDKAHLVGNSYGGAAALRLALDRPDKVDRLILMGPGGVGHHPGPPDEGPEHAVRLLRRRGPDPGEARLVHPRLPGVRRRRRAGRADRPPLRGEHPAGRGRQPAAAPTIRPGALRTLLRMDFTRDRRLARLRDADPGDLGGRRQGQPPLGRPSLARTMPNCDLYLAARTGHWVQWEQPDLFNSLALDFLGGKEASR